MLRIKLPGGRVSPERAARDRRDLEPLRPRRRRALDAAERPAALARARRAAGGVRPPRRRRAHDRGRLRRRRPQHHRLPGRRASTPTSSSTRSRSSTRRPSSSTATPTTRTCRASTSITIAACADRCNAPEINCIALVGVVHEGVEGFAVLVGGGLSSVPRIARDLGVFVPKEEAVEVLRAMLDAWKEDLRYRVSRVKARLKFMVDDYRPGGHARARSRRRLGRTLEDFALPPIPATLARPHRRPRRRSSRASRTSACPSTSASSPATR